MLYKELWPLLCCFTTHHTIGYDNVKHYRNSTHWSQATGSASKEFPNNALEKLKSWSKGDNFRSEHQPVWLWCPPPAPCPWWLWTAAPSWAVGHSPRHPHQTPREVGLCWTASRMCPGCCHGRVPVRGKLGLVRPLFNPLLKHKLHVNDFYFTSMFHFKSHHSSSLVRRDASQEKRWAV